MASLPDHTKLSLPSLSPTMETGQIAEWLKKEGEEVKPGDTLAKIKTDKATVDFDSTDAGYIAKILVQAGEDDVPVGQLIAILVEDKADVAAFANFSGEAAVAPAAEAKPEKPKAKEAEPEAKQAQAQTQAPAHGASGSRVVASPLAKKVAADKGIDISQVRGTGPNNRIVRADVEEYQGAPAPAKAQQAQQPASGKPTAVAAASSGSYVDIPNSKIRQVIAQRLTQSKSTIPHYYLSVDLNVDKLLKVREEFNAKLEKSFKSKDKSEKAPKLSVNDFIIKASALALRKVPAVNSSWSDSFVRQYNYVDICVAVSTDAGLITPIIADADQKGLSAISESVRDLATRARDNKLLPHEFQGGTFTISNLGMFGVKNFSAIINPPQAAILAVGTTEQRVVPNDKADAAGNQYKTSSFMSVTLSCDHRVVDGAVGAQWLAAFRGYVEDPMSMLL